MALALHLELVNARLGGRAVTAWCHCAIKHAQITEIALCRTRARVKKAGPDTTAHMPSVRKNVTMVVSAPNLIFARVPNGRILGEMLVKRVADHCLECRMVILR
jgi:hypothetical protein